MGSHLGGARLHGRYVSQTSDGSSPGLCHSRLPLLMRCFSPDRIPGVSMMLMLSKTGLGSWAHMNLHKSKSRKRERSGRGHCCCPCSTVTSASFPEARNIQEAFYRLVSRGGHKTVHVLLTGVQPAAQTGPHQQFPHVSFSPGVQEFSSQVADMLVKTARSLGHRSNTEGKQKGDTGTLGFHVKIFNHLPTFPHTEDRWSFPNAAGPSPCRPPSCLGEGTAAGGQ